MAPDTVAVPLLLISDPLIVNNSAVEYPFNSTVAPNAIVVEAVVPKALEFPSCKIPALTVVKPLYKFVPDHTNVPAPDLVMAPVVDVLAPLHVKVLAAILMVDVVALVKMKLRSVVAVAPVYSKVPPPNTKLDDELLAAPKLPDTPPFSMVATLNVPALMVVAPV